MRLGHDTASLINHLQSRATRGQPEPAVHMGATVLMWTDRWVVEVQEDRATVVSGGEHDGSASYQFERNYQGQRYVFRFDPKRGWRHVRRNDAGRWVLSEGPGLMIGRRAQYRDPSF